jgi:hypothetical protein
MISASSDAGGSFQVARRPPVGEAGWWQRKESDL